MDDAARPNMTHARHGFSHSALASPPASASSVVAAGGHASRKPMPDPVLASLHQANQLADASSGDVHAQQQGEREEEDEEDEPIRRRGSRQRAGTVSQAQVQRKRQSISGAIASAWSPPPAAPLSSAASTSIASSNKRLSLSDYVMLSPPSDTKALSSPATEHQSRIIASPSSSSTWSRSFASKSKNLLSRLARSDSISALPHSPSSSTHEPGAVRYSERERERVRLDPQRTPRSHSTISIASAAAASPALDASPVSPRANASGNNGRVTLSDRRRSWRKTLSFGEQYHVYQEALASLPSSSNVSTSSSCVALQACTGIGASPSQSQSQASPPAPAVALLRRKSSRSSRGSFMGELFGLRSARSSISDRAAFPSVAPAPSSAVKPSPLPQHEPDSQARAQEEAADPRENDDSIGKRAGHHRRISSTLRGAFDRRTSWTSSALEAQAGASAGGESPVSLKRSISLRFSGASSSVGSDRDRTASASAARVSSGAEAKAAPSTAVSMMPPPSRPIAAEPHPPSAPSSRMSRSLMRAWPSTSSLASMASQANSSVSPPSTAPTDASFASLRLAAQGLQDLPRGSQSPLDRLPSAARLPSTAAARPNMSDISRRTSTNSLGLTFDSELASSQKMRKSPSSILLSRFREFSDGSRKSSASSSSYGANARAAETNSIRSPSPSLHVASPSLHPDPRTPEMAGRPLSAQTSPMEVLEDGTAECPSPTVEEVPCEAKPPPLPESQPMERIKSANSAFTLFKMRKSNALARSFSTQSLVSAFRSGTDDRRSAGTTSPSIAGEDFAQEPHGGNALGLGLGPKLPAANGRAGDRRERQASTASTASSSSGTHSSTLATRLLRPRSSRSLLSRYITDGEQNATTSPIEREAPLKKPGSPFFLRAFLPASSSTATSPDLEHVASFMERKVSAPGLCSSPTFSDPPHGNGLHAVDEARKETPHPVVRVDRILPPEQIIATLDEIRRLDPASAAAARHKLERSSFRDLSSAMLPPPTPPAAYSPLLSSSSSRSKHHSVPSPQPGRSPLLERASLSNIGTAMRGNNDSEVQASLPHPQRAVKRVVRARGDSVKKVVSLSSIPASPLRAVRKQNTPPGSPTHRSPHAKSASDVVQPALPRSGSAGTFYDRRDSPRKAAPPRSADDAGDTSLGTMGSAYSFASHSSR